MHLYDLQDATPEAPGPSRECIEKLRWCKEELLASLNESSFQMGCEIRRFLDTGPSI